jgi:hypothetical protein
MVLGLGIDLPSKIGNIALNENAELHEQPRSSCLRTPAQLARAELSYESDLVLVVKPSALSHEP